MLSVGGKIVNNRYITEILSELDFRYNRIGKKTIDKKNNDFGLDKLKSFLPLYIRPNSMIHDCYHQVFRNNHLLIGIKNPRQTR